MITTSRLAPVVAGLLIVSAAVAGQLPGRPSDINRYRDHFLKDDAPDPKDGAVRVTFLGTATLLFDDGETQLMTDGFFSRPPLLQLARKIETDTATVDAALKRAGV